MAVRTDMCCATSTILFVQNERSKRYLAKIGISRVTVVGDTRFDRVLQIREEAKTSAFGGAFQEQHDDFRGRKLLAAGRGFVY